MNIEQMMTEAFAEENKELREQLSKFRDDDMQERLRLVSIELLARDLLARLSRDYGDSEGGNDAEVDELFERGQRLIPIVDRN